MVEQNYILKEGKVPILKRAGEGLFNYPAELAALEARLGESFDRHLLSQAFITQSHVQQEAEQQRELGVENVVNLQDNSNLEKQGIKVIRDTLERWLIAALPKFPREGVEALLEYLTKEEMLADVGFHLSLRELVLTASYPPTGKELAQGFSAMVGALVNSDQARAEQLVIDILGSQLAGKELNELWSLRDPMGLLVNLLKEEGRSQPESRLLWKTGPGTILASYRVGIYVDRELLGESPGESLDIAEEMAARDALRNMFGTGEASPPLPWGRLPNRVGN